MITYDKTKYIKPDYAEIYRQVNGINLPVHIFNPKQQNDKNKYVVICIHGGGWTTGRKDNDEWSGGDMIHQARIFAQLGYVGVAISYRSIKNDDTDILDLIDDCKKAVLYVKEKLNTDNEHIVLIGDSAGAHLATNLGISDDDGVRPKMVIACNPVLDCVNKFQYASDNEETRLLASPLFAKVNKCAEFLFINGDADRTTPVEDAAKMNKKLNDAGFKSELIVLKGILHAFILYDYRSTDGEVIRYMEIIEKYLDEKLS